MAALTLVMVLDEEDPRHGQVSVFDDTSRAGQVVEGLLEAGLTLDRIRVFESTEFAIQVSHKPVVSFGQGEAQAGADQVETTPPAEGPFVPDSGAGNNGSETAFEGDASTEGESAPLVEDGAKVSSLFRGD